MQTTKPLAGRGFVAGAGRPVVGPGADVASADTDADAAMSCEVICQDVVKFNTPLCGRVPDFDVNLVSDDLCHLVQLEVAAGKWEVSKASLTERKSVKPSAAVE
jgi:hypothetical protein